MEYIEINGVRHAIPAEIVSQGRDAVADYIATLAPPQPAARAARGT